MIYGSIVVENPVKGVNFMDYIIKINNETYFGGWNPVFGDQIFTSDIKLAYRMRSSLATRTLEKLRAKYPEAEIIKYDQARVA